MLTATEMQALTPIQRKEKIYAEVPHFDQISEDIEKSRAVSQVINSFVDDYFNLRIESDENDPSGSILSANKLEQAIQSEIDRFKPDAIDKLRQAIPTKKSLENSYKNLYEMSGAVKLSFANSVTRTLSTTMGLLWERLASISPHSINPEREFGLKLVGIDLISKNIHTSIVEYQQLKTKKDTLTGSQKPRSVKELEIHSNPVFCVSFDNKGTWTFNDEKIPRVSGAEFWGRIGIPYGVVLEKTKILISDLEDEYVRSLS
ncbi:MAG: hypothetical protein HN472_06865 [Nitrospina sp.]|nr:hypothetical protein [Nitrospina sp.]MBT4048081.1 hypothetical protein [Nitrospina sp.]MBT4559213.1 hypothetical protein [Nitrospina sp.]MBT6600098.1 hypothetical protein [Nitrospina sp.]MBT7196469.1 hypothetical protein [Nitrospina sp.]